MLGRNERHEAPPRPQPNTAQGRNWNRRLTRAVERARTHAVCCLFTAGLASCSGKSSSPTSPTSQTSDARGSESATDAAPSEQANPSSDSHGSSPTVGNGESNESAAPEVTQTPTASLIEPGEPTVLASQVVFGARLCLGDDQRIYFPNRIGYPETPGLEELWVVSRTGGDARSVATPGSVTGCVQAGTEVWTSRNDASTIGRTDAVSGTQLEAYATPGTPLQVAGNSTHVFASLLTMTPSAEVVSIDPNTLGAPRTLWSKPGRVTALWLNADDERLVFSAKDTETTASWVVRIGLSPETSAELVATTGELGAVDEQGGVVYYTHYDRGELRAFDVDTATDTVMTTLPGTWSLVVDGEFVYVTTRPDYCSAHEGKLYRIPTVGGEPTLLADNLDCPTQLVTDARGLYWMNAGSWQGPESTGLAPADGSVMFLPRK